MKWHKFLCTACEREFSIAPDAIGTRAVCPNCKATITVPTQEEDRAFRDALAARERQRQEEQRRTKALLKESTKQQKEEQRKARKQAQEERDGDDDEQREAARLKYEKMVGEREEAMKEALEREEAWKKRDGNDDLRPLTRHALKLYIFIGWGVIVLGAIGLIAFFVRLANQG